MAYVDIICFRNRKEVFYVPNNIVFNNVASEMQTQIFGQNGSNVLPIAVDAAGNIITSAVPVFTNTSTTLGVGTSTIDVIVADTSAQRMYSFYVKNTGAANTVTALLQISPSNTATFYVNDSSTAYSLGPGSAAVLVAQKYLNFTKLQLIASAASATVQCYYNSQS